MVVYTVDNTPTTSITFVSLHTGEISLERFQGRSLLLLESVNRIRVNLSKNIGRERSV